MFQSAMVIVATLLIVLLILILLSSTPFSGTIYKRPLSCPSSNGTKNQISILQEMNGLATPPVHQPIYRYARNVPKDAVSEVERRYCKDAVRLFSKGKLELLDIENVDWFTDSESSPIVALLDARVSIVHSHEVLRIIMMWKSNSLWSIKLANAKGCFRPVL